MIEFFTSIVFILVIYEIYRYINKYPNVEAKCVLEVENQEHSDCFYDCENTFFQDEKSPNPDSEQISDEKNGNEEDAKNFVTAESFAEKRKIHKPTFQQLKSSLEWKTEGNRSYNRATIPSLPPVLVKGHLKTALECYKNAFFDILFKTFLSILFVCTVQETGLPFNFGYEDFVYNLYAQCRIVCSVVCSSMFDSNMNT